MTDTQLIDGAFKLAVNAHSGQVDKSGRAYIAHVVRVWHDLHVHNESAQTQALGLLHDTIEDTDLTTDQIGDNLISDNCFMKDLDLLTRKDQQTYQDYINGIMTSRRATIVKLSDLSDHINNQEYISDSLNARYTKVYHQLLQSLLNHA